MSIFLCIPLLTCAVVSAVLHGAAYSHFISIHQHRLFLEDHGYKCSDFDSGAGFMCRCAKTALSRQTDYKNVPIPCSQQKDVSSYHGALLALSAVTFALLLMILVLCIFLLLRFFNLQVSELILCHRYYCVFIILVLCILLLHLFNLDSYYYFEFVTRKSTRSCIRGNLGTLFLISCMHKNVFLEVFRAVKLRANFNFKGSTLFDTPHARPKIRSF